MSLFFSFGTTTEETSYKMKSPTTTMNRSTMRVVHSLYLMIGMLSLMFIVIIYIISNNLSVQQHHENQQDTPSLQSSLSSSSSSLIDTNNDIHITELRNIYLDTVAMGLLGGLTHMAEIDKTSQSSSDPKLMSRCLTRDWRDPNNRPDFCLVKWDGYERIMQVRHIYEKIRNENIEGDLIECGVWRGGLTIMMRALLKAYNDKERIVWVSDSFNGVPNTKQQKEHPNFHNIPKKIQDKDEKMWGSTIVQKMNGKNVIKNVLTVEGHIVENNFRRFSLLDEQVKFLPGWFNEILPNVHDEYGLNKIAFLRIDGDLYSSTMDVLINLYKYVTPGGYIFFDDYNLIPSKKAIHDFFNENKLNISEIQNYRVTGNKTKYYENEDITKAMGAYYKKPLL